MRGKRLYAKALRQNETQIEIKIEKNVSQTSIHSRKHTHVYTCAHLT